MKKKLLFVTEHFCDGKPEMGVTNSYHNLFGSFKHSTMANEYDFNVIHYDDFQLKGKHIDDFASLIQEKTKPDVMICTLLGTEQCNPTEKFFEVFKQAGCKIIFLWPDFGRDWTIRSAVRFDRFIHKNVAIAGERNGNYPKTIWSWTPEDPTYFFWNDKIQKTKNLTFLGTVHSQERQGYIKMLQAQLPKEFDLRLGGGQRAEKLSHEKYAEVTRDSQAIINFPFSVAGNDQLKGRIFEATACKCLLFERKNILTPQYFEPGKEYIEYTSQEDLFYKIKHFFSDGLNEGRMIAQAGYERYNRDWNHNKFWENFFKEIDK